MYIFIINPVAGAGRAKRIHEKLRKTERYQNMKTISYHTQYKGHAEVLAENVEQIHEKYWIEAIIVIGGDGTMHEVLNGLKNKQIPVSFLPGGSGNDFARGLALPKNPDTIMENVLRNKEPAEYWLGLLDEKNGKKRYFINCLGFGFDAVVARSVNKSYVKKLLNALRIGMVTYIFILIRELIRYKPIPLTIELDNELKSYDHCFFFVINNHPFFGGGMKINPTAKNDREVFSIMIVDSISKWKVFALFGTVFTGKHVKFKEVAIYQAKQITVTSDFPIPFQADGETGSTQHCVINKRKEPVFITGATSDKNRIK